MVPSLSLLSCELSVSVKKTLIEKKIYLSIYLSVCLSIYLSMYIYYTYPKKAKWWSILSPNRCSKSLFSRETEGEALLFVNFNIITKYIFHKNFNETHQVAQNIWRYPSSMMAIFVNLLDFLIFPCYKKVMTSPYDNSFLAFRTDRG